MGRGTRGRKEEEEKVQAKLYPFHVADLGLKGTQPCHECDSNSGSIDQERQDWMMNFFDRYDLPIMRSLRGPIVCCLFSSRISYAATR
jgi:hypothetical protein